ncbi:MAG: SDR family oxidoreductase [Candidatus Eremiobacteraeota bacterium]|nr:SDR family oxidoreductase [Candidatus Eremiobacteraeota bacterium]
MDLKIRGRVALVTGGSAGLGKAIALGLAVEGVKIAVAARRRERLEEVVRAARERGAQEARAYDVDLSDGSGVNSLLERVESDYGTPDILILNGGGPKPGTVSEVSLEDWDDAYRSMLRNMLELAGAVVPSMRRRKWGRIVALASSSVKQPIPSLALSNSMRVALVSALKTLSMDVAADGVTVNAIATGRVDTDRLRELYPDETSMKRAAKDEIPIGRVATADEYAPMAVFLCSELARYVTGQTIAIDGGLIKSLY